MRRRGKGRKLPALRPLLSTFSGAKKGGRRGGVWKKEEEEETFYAISDV